MGCREGTQSRDLAGPDSGANHLDTIIEATNLTHLFLTPMGAKVATQKSIFYAGDQPTRKTLKHHKWAL